MDSPTLAIVTNTQNKPGNSCCSKCKIQGLWFHGALSFHGHKDALPRTHEEFALKTLHTDKKQNYHLSKMIPAIATVPNITI